MAHDVQARWREKLAMMFRFSLPPLAFVGLISLSVLAFDLLSLSRHQPVGVRGSPPPGIYPTTGCEDRYLDLLKKYLTRYDFADSYGKLSLNSPLRRLVGKVLASRGLELVRVVPADATARLEGRDWPITAETMIGMKRLDNLEYCIKDVLQRRVPGDLIEAGAWRGGATIFMRAVLKVYRDEERRVWVADSFQGLPKPNPRLYPDDTGDTQWTFTQLAVPVEEVRANFARYGLLDDRVKFLVGWFSDTLPRAPIERLAVLRIDADMYQSTVEALRYLYPKLSVGGYVIIDDYGAIKACRRAVEDFRAAQGITEELKHIDWTGVYWRK